MNGLEQGYETYIFNSKGSITEVAAYEKGSLVQRTVTEYDENNRRTRVTRYDGDGNITSFDVCEFDQKKYKEKVYQYDANGTLQGYLVNAYDIHFLVIVEEAYDAEDHLISTTRWKYVSGKITYDASKGFPGKA